MSRRNYLKTYRRISKQVERLINETESDNDHNKVLIKDHSPTLSLSDVTDLSSEFDIDTDISTENKLELESNIDVLKQIENLQTELASWLVDSQCSREHADSLLSILRKHGLNLPKDSRTLRQVTPSIIPCSNKCGGSYYYFGLENTIVQFLKENPAFVNDQHVIELKVNVDGLPLKKSSADNFWPILCCVKNYRPFVVCLFYGKGKPYSVQEFLSDFISEYKKLKSDNICYINKIFSVSILAFICDAPARSYLKCIKSHSGYNACERCQIKGRRVDNCIVYDNDEAVYRKRTDEEFIKYVYKDIHQNNISPLMELSFPCVTGFILDYMHTVCLGVLKRMLKFWKEGPACCKISNIQLNQISELLISMRCYIPSEFARKPRSLAEVKRWKATELRQFLLYTGPVILKDVINSNIYQHFLALSISMTIYLTDNIEKRVPLLQYAEELMHSFVRKSGQLYGQNFCVYNVHNLLHLGDDVRHFQCSLNQLSSFPFENFLQSLKRLVRSGPNPLVQVVKRLEEMKLVGRKKESNQNEIKITANSHLSSDSCILLKHGNFAVVQEVVEDGFICDIYAIGQGKEFYSRPCSSTLLSVLHFKAADAIIGIFVRKCDVKCKAICLPIADGYVMMPVRNGIESYL